MRHGKKNNHLGRTTPHRKSMLSNMANSLILSKRIVTTVAKAKELRKYIEPLLTKSKEDTTHNRRVLFSYLKSKESIKTLFGEVSEKIANRPGGYTRIIKLGTRQGDAAETALIELVDYNEILLSSTAEAPAKAKRTRRAGSKKSDAVVAASTETIADAVVVEDSPVAVVEEESPIVAEDSVADVDNSDATPDNEASPDEYKKPEA
jgi:large subunit ribosomal protein L17